MNTRGRVLLIPDLSEEATRLVAALRHRGFDASVADSLEASRKLLGSGKLDAVLVGPDPVEGDVVGLCRELSTISETPVLLVAPTTSPAILDAATRAGAFSVLSAPVDLGTLDLTLDRAAEHSELRRELERLEEVMRGRRGFGDLLGASPAMQRLYDVLERSAHSDVSVLLSGESGTGKEMVARAIHRGGPRARGPFVAVNLAAVPDGLIESELFGHARGAFTDARSARRGLFVQASGGTLFLDEIGELSLSLQPKLLRAIQERVVRPVGSDQEVPFDARIVAATNRDLEAMVANGSFRQDLYYRLAVIQVELPPLRDRGPDILVLAEHFLLRAAQRTGKELGGLLPPVQRALLQYRWPGNVRELENVIERAVALTREDRIGIEDLPERIRANRDPVRAALPDLSVELAPMHVVEERHIRAVLAAVGGNKTRAAQVLGFDRKTLYRKLTRYDITSD